MPGLDGSPKKGQPAPNNAPSVIPKELHEFSSHTQSLINSEALYAGSTASSPSSFTD